MVQNDAELMGVRRNRCMTWMQRANSPSILYAVFPLLTSSGPIEVKCFQYRGREGIKTKDCRRQIEVRFGTEPGERLTWISIIPDEQFTNAGEADGDASADLFGRSIAKLKRSERMAC